MLCAYGILAKIEEQTAEYAKLRRNVRNLLRTSRENLAYSAVRSSICNAILLKVTPAANPEFMRMAIALATKNVAEGLGGPFGAVIVRDGEVVAAEANSVTRTNDPTAHAEVNAIRAACAKLGSFQLEGCDVYTSCEPCPMCLAALYWSRCRAIYYGNTAKDAAEAGFDDSFLYDEVKRPAAERSLPIEQVLGEEALASFEAWRKSVQRIDY